jgi:hypothetical protein
LLTSAAVIFIMGKTIQPCPCDKNCKPGNTKSNCIVRYGKILLRYPPLGLPLDEPLTKERLCELLKNLVGFI